MTIEQTIPFVIGVTTFLVTGADFLVRKWLQKHRDETIKDLTDKRSAAEGLAHQLRADLAAAEQAVTKVTDERDESRAEVSALREENRSQTAQIEELRAGVSGLAGEQERLRSEQRTHENRIRRALELEGAIWTQPVMAGTRPFRPLSDRRTPIVSVLNLKGGVGKTTLTAYLGWALARRGYRVLLVDLDLQGSLSSLFYPADELARLAKDEGHLLQHFLSDVIRKKGIKLLDYALPIPQLNASSRLVATTDKLAYAELSQTVRWLLRVGGTNRQWNGRHDGRMILRRALHAKGLYQKFDVILLDCPPLINLCCANALAASDYVLTPMVPSLKSVERVTPLLRRVVEIRENGVNLALGMLGLVVNHSQEKELTRKEEDLLFDLPRRCKDVWHDDVYRFDTIVPQRVHIRDGESGFDPRDDNPVAPTFEQLAEEFVKRLPACCRQPGEGRQRSRPRLTGGEE
jgi:cellulose biosynthesis protein BcsQ